MINLSNIIKGWIRFLFYKRSRMAKERLAVCWQCPLRKGVFCGVCFCELHAKAEIVEEHCPKYKWDGDYRHKYNFIDAGNGTYRLK